MLKNIKLLREEIGISQQKLADAIGMSQSSINDYENRGIEPDIATLVKIADYFSTSVDFVVGNTGQRNPFEKADKYTLDNEEKALIDDYRTLPDSGRKAVGAVVAEMRKLGK